MVDAQLGELTTIADLEICGLSVHTIGLLEKMGYLYIRELEQLTEKELRAEPNVRDATLAEIRNALRNYQEGRAVETVRQCVEIQRSNRKKRKVR